MILLKKGFTLIEMLIVVSIIGFLLLIFIPKTETMLTKTDSVTTKLNANSLETAAFQFELDNHQLPISPSYTYSATADVEQALKNKLTNMGYSSNDYSSIEHHLYELDQKGLQSYMKASDIGNYFIIDGDSPFLAGYIVSKKPMQIDHSSKDFVFIPPSGLFVTNENTINSLSFTTINTIYTGYLHGGAIKSDGTLWMWGYNNNGQLGIGNTTSQNVPVQVGSDTNWKSLALGEYFSIGMKSDGSLWSWGSNTYGELGLGDTTKRLFPVKIGVFNDWKSINAGAYHVAALKNDGTAWSWGYGSSRLCQGDSTPRYSPTKIGADQDWAFISSGRYHTLFIKNNNSLWVCGFNGDGQLGLGDTTERFVPTQIGNQRVWKEARGGWGFSVALKTDGTLWSWGSASDGELGNNINTGKFLSPIQVGIDKDWNKINTGPFHTLAIKKDGSLWGWGGNYNRQLGTGDNVNKLIPTRIGSGNNWKSVSGNLNCSYGLKTDGSLWTWGDNGYGQIAQGAVGYKSIPSQVGSNLDW